ncbi:MAG: hypothetical protein KatS3mg038_2995 [Candidatus Kapaibacterium sp.]|nr:MAG: hypothetical protein KatS3mg038_2995 [Candidatus Kapabacteria bacterium]
MKCPFCGTVNTLRIFRTYRNRKYYKGWLRGDCDTRLTQCSSCKRIVITVTTVDDGATRQFLARGGGADVAALASASEQSGDRAPTPPFGEEDGD